MSRQAPSEKYAALEKEMLEILNQPKGPMRAEMPRLMQIEEEMSDARAEESQAWIAAEAKKSAEARAKTGS